jgi:hypothetical protein
MSDEMKEPIVLDISGRISMESEEMNQIPASGIYINTEDESRKAHVKDAISDELFPEVIHFEVIRDIEDRSAYDSFKEIISRMSYVAKNDVEDDFEVYDELISIDGKSLTLHISVEDSEVYEAYLTIDGDSSVDGFDINSGSRDFSPEMSEAFLSFVEEADASNVRSVPLSFLNSYFEAYDLSDWENTVLRETNGFFDQWPIHVEH